MMNYLVAGVDKMSNPAEQLRSTLRTLEEQHIGEISSELTQARNCVLEVIPTYATSHYQFGRVLYGYKIYFTAVGGWVAAARAIAAVVRCSAKTIFRITHDYEQISGLDPVFVEALEDQGIDPAAPKNAKIVAEILDMRPPSNPEEAAGTVAAMVRDDKSRRRTERARRTAEKQQQKQENKAEAELITDKAQNKPVGQRLDTSSNEADESTEELALRIADEIQKRLQPVAADQRTTEANRIFGMIGKSLGMVITVGKFPPRRILPPKPWEAGNIA